MELPLATEQVKGEQFINKLLTALVSFHFSKDMHWAIRSVESN
jgi:hypothetical protein